MRRRLAGGMALLLTALACTGSSGPTSSTPSAQPTVSSTPIQTAAPTITRAPTASPAESPSPSPSASPFASSANVTVRPLGSMPGATLGYIEYLPPGYGDGVPRPLLLFFHGSSESGDGSAGELERLPRTGVPWLIQTDSWPADRPFVVLSPQHEAVRGSPCTEGDEVEAFLDWAVEQYEVDRARLYLTGVSCGAIGAWEYLGRRTDEAVAAAVLMAGDGREAVAEAGCDLGRVPIWAFHGEADTSVDQRGSIEPIETLNECTDPPPLDARLTVFPGVGHAIWNPIYSLALGPENDIYSWLLTHENEPDR